MDSEFGNAEMIKQPQTADWPTSKLKPHPARAIRRRHPEHVVALAENIAECGLRQPLEILPDGTILCGHHRLEAVQSLGWKKVPVRVRYDLQHDPTAAEIVLHEDNLLGPQLSPLERARHAERLLELKDPERGCDRRALQKFVADRMKCEWRTVNRLLQILRLPRTLQDAFEDRRIGFREAARFLALPFDTREQIIALVDAGALPRTTINEAYASIGSRRFNPRKSQQTKIRFLKAVELLEQSVSGPDFQNRLGPEDRRRLKALGKRLAKALAACSRPSTGKRVAESKNS